MDEKASTSESFKNTTSFIAKIAKQGKNTRIITIPKIYWVNGIVDENKVYKVILIEIEVKKK